MEHESRERMISRMREHYRNDETFRYEVAHDFGGSIHGDIRMATGALEIDIEFINISRATDFSDYVRKYVQAVDIRHGDTISSLTQTVTLTVLTF